MQIRGRMRVKSEPCHGCGEVRELVGEYPEWIMLCYPCQGTLHLHMLRSGRL